MLHDKQDYGRGLAEFAKKFIEASGGRGQVVLFEGITPGAVDYSAVIQKVRQSGAEAVIYGGYHPEASKLVSGMRKKKIELPFISDDGVKDDTFIKVAGAFAEGVYASGPRDTSTNPLAIKAVAAHRAAFGGDPGRSTSTPGRRRRRCSTPSRRPAPRIRPRSRRRCTPSSSRRPSGRSASTRAGMPRASASRCTVSRRASTSR